MKGVEQLAAIKTVVNVYRMNVTFGTEVQGTEIAAIAPSAEEAVNLIRTQLENVTNIDAPTLVIGGAYLFSTDAPTPPPTAPPANVDVPFVSGTGTVGESLNCTMGNWTGEPTSYDYKWKSDGTTDIGSGADYTVQASDAGHSLTCVVTATNALGSTEAPPSNAVVVAEAGVETAQESHSSKRRR